MVPCPSARLSVPARAHSSKPTESQLSAVVLTVWSQQVTWYTLCTHCTWSSVYETVERPSVCPSTGPQQQTRCCRHAAVGPEAGDIDRLLACKERKCGGTSASRDENGQVDVWR